MIVVAIIGILAAIAIPAYADYIRRGRLTEAVGQLADMRVKMEQFFQDNRTYEGACVATTVARLPANTQFFDYSCTLAPSTFAVHAVGKGAMDAFKYDLEQDGTKRTIGLPSGWNGASATSTCWVIKKDGSC